MIKAPSCSIGMFLGILSNGITLAIVTTVWIKSFQPTSIIITNGRISHELDYRYKFKYDYCRNTTRNNTFIHWKS